MKAENKKPKKYNVLNYAVIMIICFIIIILIAAMADNRENEMDSRIMETEQANESIQSEAERLRAENYTLTKENEELKTTTETQTLSNEKTSSLTSIWTLYSSGDEDGAKQLAANINTAELDENQNAYFCAICEILNIDPETKQPKDN